MTPAQDEEAEAVARDMPDEMKRSFLQALALIESGDLLPVFTPLGHRVAAALRGKQ